MSSVPLTSTQPSTNYRWIVCALLFFATTINYIDRQILALIGELQRRRRMAVLFISHDLNLCGEIADAVVVMRPDTAIRKLVNATPGLLTIAWVRNRVDEWVEGGLLDAYDLIFASSRKACAALHEATGLAV